MVAIGIVRMGMRHRLVTVPVRMAGVCAHWRGMRVLVVLVMFVFVIVPKWFVQVGMLMRFGDVQPYTKRHQHTGNKQFACHRLAHPSNGNHRAGKRCC